MKRMKKLFLCIVLSGCFILPSTASAIGPSPDLWGWVMSLLKNDDYDRQALIAQYRRSKQESEPDVTAQAFISGDRRVRGGGKKGGYKPPRLGSPCCRVAASTR